MQPSDLHVIAVMSNPMRYHSRVRLMKEFLARMAKSGCTMWFVEATFGERGPQVADANNPNHIILRSDDEIWLKESMVNVARNRLPADAKYIMWCDGDIEFARDNWAEEVLHHLQHYHTVQPFSDVIDLGKFDESLETHTGFAKMYEDGHPFTPGKGTFWHPGYAWAWRASAWDAVGGMIDRAICGAADHHMAAALIGHVDWTVPGNVHANYKKMVADWQAKAEAFKGNHGHVMGTIMHHYHGPKAKRYYVERWGILTENDYDPDVDVVIDKQGLISLTGNKPKLRRDLRKYMGARDEDA